MNNFTLGHRAHLCSIYRNHVQCMTIYRENLQFIAFSCAMNHDDNAYVSHTQIVRG